MRLQVALPLVYLVGVASASTLVAQEVLTPTPTTSIEHYTYFCAAVAPDGTRLNHSSLSEGMLYCPYGEDSATSCAYSPINGELDTALSHGSCHRRAKFSDACHFTCPSSGQTGPSVVWWRRPSPPSGGSIVLECGYAHTATHCTYSVANGTVIDPGQEGICPDEAVNSCNSSHWLKNKREDTFQRLVKTQARVKRDIRITKMLGTSGAHDGL